MIFVILLVRVGKIKVIEHHIQRWLRKTANKIIQKYSVHLALSVQGPTLNVRIWRPKSNPALKE